MVRFDISNLTATMDFTANFYMEALMGRSQSLNWQIAHNKDVILQEVRRYGKGLQPEIDRTNGNIRKTHEVIRNACRISKTVVMMNIKGESDAETGDIINILDAAEVAIQNRLNVIKEESYEAKVADLENTIREMERENQNLEDSVVGLMEENKALSSELLNISAVEPGIPLAVVVEEGAGTQQVGIGTDFEVRSPRAFLTPTAQRNGNPAREGTRTRRPNRQQK